jgi:DtxR family Mn-dependent transcriptional regulator
LTDLSEYEEMYLKRMFEFHDNKPGSILKTTKLASLMNVSPASATEMIQRLASSDLVTHIPYRGCRLTPSGFQISARIKRREGLLEILLSDVIGYSGDVSEAACKMEHNMNSELEAALDRMLGYPENTPSGNKIPVIERSVDFDLTGLLLPIKTAPDGVESIVEVIALGSTDAKTLQSLGISIGSVILKSESETFCDGNRVEISDLISRKILVRVGGDLFDRRR